MPELTCPKCQGNMELGFQPDGGYGGGAVSPPQWVSGPMVTSFWKGLRLRGRTRRWVTTYRCTACGYLEAYAR
jgi:hypothetical protein